MCQYSGRYFYQDKEGKVRTTENKEKERVSVTDFGNHVTT